MKPYRRYADPLQAIARGVTRASIGPGNSWVADAPIVAPYRIQHADTRGWVVTGAIDGASEHYRVQAIDMPKEFDRPYRPAPTFRTWRDAWAACQRLFPNAETWLCDAGRNRRRLDSSWNRTAAPEHFAAVRARMESE